MNKHFYPYFGHRRLNRISPSLVQDWVTQAAAAGLSPRSIRKYHVMLSSVFARAVKDRVLGHNPCDHTELPKVITRRARTLTPDEYTRLLAEIPDQHRLMVQTLIEAGLRWGELVALKPRHIDFLRRSLTVEETIVEVSKRHSPTGQRYLLKPYPPEGQRTPHLRRPPSLARRHRPAHPEGNSRIEVRPVPSPAHVPAAAAPGAARELSGLPAAQ